MQFSVWLESRKFSHHMRDDLRELFIKYLPLVRNSLNKTGLDIEFSDNQLLGYINFVAGFSIPAEERQMIRYADNIAKLILQKIFKEVIEDKVVENTRSNSNIKELLQRDISVSLDGELENLKLTVSLGSQAYDSEEEKELNLHDVLTGRSQELKNMILSVANNIKIS